MPEGREVLPAGQEESPLQATMQRNFYAVGLTPETHCIFPCFSSKGVAGRHTNRCPLRAPVLFPSIESSTGLFACSVCIDYHGAAINTGTSLKTFH